LKELLLALVVAYPAILFLWKVRKLRRAASSGDYFLADQTLDAGGFVDTSVAYGYQIAALSLFATWGYSYGFWTLWVPVFWALGFYLLRYGLQRGYLDSFLAHEEELTLHGFVSSAHQSRALARLAAVVSILGLSGTAFFEAEFTGSILGATVESDAVSNIAFLGFTAVAVIYILIGGFRAVVATDHLQLAFGFVGFSIVTALTFIRAAQHGYIVTAVALASLSSVSTAALLWLHSKLHSLNHLSFPRKLPLGLLFSFLAQAGALAFSVWLAFTESPLDSFSYFLREQQLGNLFSLGHLALLSLLVANGLWQVVDISNWQRLGALNTDLRARKRTELATSISFVAVYSAVTWAIAIFFGMALRHLGSGIESAWTALQETVLTLFASDGLVDSAYVLILLFAMISIMFSTLDSLISALSFTAYKDLSSGSTADAISNLRRARIWTLAYAVTFLIIYKVVRIFASSVDDILYTFYAFQLALFAAVAASTIAKRRNRLSAYLSIIGGSVLCLLPLTGWIPALTPYNSAALFAVFGGGLFYLFGLLFSRYRVEDPAATGPMGQS